MKAVFWPFEKTALSLMLRGIYIGHGKKRVVRLKERGRVLGGTSTMTMYVKTSD